MKDKVDEDEEDETDEKSLPHMRVSFNFSLGLF